MRLREALRRILPERTVETATFEEFMELVRQRGIPSIEAHMSRINPGLLDGAHNTAVGTIGNFEYFNRYLARDLSGRIVCDEKYEKGTIFGSDQGFSDYAERDTMWTLLAVTAINRLTGARGSVPGIRTTLFFGDTEVSRGMLEKLTQVQKAQHITPLVVKR